MIFHLVIILAGKSCGRQKVRPEVVPSSARAYMTRKMTISGQISTFCKREFQEGTRSRLARSSASPVRNLVTSNARSGQKHFRIEGRFKLRFFTTVFLLRTAPPVSFRTIIKQPSPLESGLNLLEQGHCIKESHKVSHEEHLLDMILEAMAR